MNAGALAPFAAEALLAWYDKHRRHLPWRAPPGAAPDPYKVWLSEIMLQQTTVKAVAPYYADFLRRWPTVHALAAASLDDVLSAWAGLGYYARARNLHACALQIANVHGGRFPDTEEELLALPGVGPYTAAAIAAIAFNRPTAAVDSNVERVVARLFAHETPLPAAKTALWKLAAGLVPSERPGDFAQAMMDLGAVVCTPRAPSCTRCPIQAACEAHAGGLEAELPYRAAKADKPMRCGTAFFAQRPDGAVLLRKRPAKGLLGGMAEVPGTPWADAGCGVSGTPLDYAPVAAAWARVPGLVRHTFTHFHLELEVFSATVSERACVRDRARPQDCVWVPEASLDAQALPSVMRKVVAHVFRYRVSGVRSRNI